jgi:GSH-dependent disulfide-bond oxidoreductase
MIDLYTWNTANGRRASVVLAESGLPHRLHKIDFEREAKQPDFLAINPAGQIPVMVDHAGPGGRLVLAQSGAIVLYAADKSGRFLPVDPQRRATAYQWFMMGASDVAGAHSAVFLLENDAPEKSAANVEFFKRRFVRFYGLLDQQLRGREFIADELSIADLMLYPTYFARKALLESAGGLTDLHRWAERMAARPAVRQGMQQ